MKKKITLLLLEITAVVVLVSLLVVLGIDRYNRVFNDYPVYVVEFNDVDGLDIGCPVRFAGLQVGHIVKEEIKNDKILVAFKITRKGMKLPEGCTAGIESTGLVGSKSLEIRPPTAAASGGALIHPKDPLRISSMLEIQNMMGEVLLEISDNVAHFLEKNKNNTNAGIQKAGKTLHETTKKVKESEKAIEETTQAVVQKTKDLKKITETANDTISGVNEALNSVTKGKEARESVKKIKESTEKLSKLVEKENVEEKVTSLNKSLKGFNKNVKEMNTELDKIKKRETGYIKEFSNSVKSTAEKLEAFFNSLQKKDEK